jgi:iron complex transport system substrate-binding protein
LLRRYLALLLVLPLLGCGQAKVPAQAAKSSPAVTAPAFPVTIVDDTGRSVTIPHEPKRIVSVTLGTDEILLGGLVEPSRVVAVTKYAADPNESWVARRVGSITQLSTANAEQILVLKPDLIFLASYTTPGVVSQLESSGIPVVEFKDFSSLADIESHILTMGRAVGNLSGAEQMVATMKSQLAAVRAKVATLPPAHILYYTPDGYVFGKDTTPDELITDAGAVNVADTAGITSWKQISLEAVASMKPEWLLTDDSQPGFAAKLLANPALAAVPAVAAHHVLALPDRDLTVVSQYFTQAVAAVAADLHPSAFGH